jgi:hypothetical protein
VTFGARRDFIMTAISKFTFSGLLSVLLLLSGCSSISEDTRGYLGAPKYPPTQPERVQILASAPTRAHEKLGEILLEATSKVSRDKLEERLRAQGANLGADAVYPAYDRMHVTPIVYADWWGPSTVGRDLRRNIVGIAIKYK